MSQLAMLDRPSTNGILDVSIPDVITVDTYRAQNGGWAALDRIMIISSDGHVSAQMEDYREYVEPTLRDDFDAFLVEYKRTGHRMGDAELLRFRTDDEEVDRWRSEVESAGRLDGYWDSSRRLRELESEGAVGEVLFPEFSVPFENKQPDELVAGHDVRPEQLYSIAGAEAYNRWLADFVATAPARYAGLALVDLSDPDRACREIQRSRASGLRGVVIRPVPDAVPLYKPQYDRVWSVMEELEMPLNIHVAISSPFPSYPDGPTPHTFAALAACEVFYLCHRTLWVLIWGGVLEKHPRLRVVFTEQQSDWVPGTLAKLDHQWSTSYLARDVRDIVPRPPSEYWSRQCYLGASLLSRAEVEAREAIGVDKLMFGIDFPHQEGTWLQGTQTYISETFGEVGVPEFDARKILGQNAAALWDFDAAQLEPIVERVGPTVEQVLNKPARRVITRGDVLRPIAIY